MKSYNPHVEVIIQRVSATGEYIERINISSWVAAMSTNKVYGRAHGTFMVRVPYSVIYKGKRFNEIFLPGDIAYISVDKGAGNGLVLVKTGLIDRVASVKTCDGEGNPRRFIDIHGSGLGKILLRHNCGWDIAFKKAVMGSFESLRENEFLTFYGTPDELAAKITTNFLINQLPFWEDHGLIIPAFSAKDDWHTIDTTLKMKSGPTWAALKDIANEPWNTLTTETSKGSLEIILQRTPFDPTPGSRGRLTIPLYVIESDDVIKQDVGVADNERVNYLRMFLPEASQRSESIVKVVYMVGDVNVFFDGDSVSRHGYHEREISTCFSPFTFDDEMGPPAPANIGNRGSQDYLQGRIKERAEGLWEWFRYDHEMKSGTFLVHGDPEITCGSGILDKETGDEYFVEQVAHEYSAEGPKLTTSAGVVRGQAHVRA